MVKYDYQVIIVGAGPAGAICAYQLASMGISVLIIEQEILPRNKPCGGALSIKAEELVDYDLSCVIANKINAVIFKYEDKQITYNGQTPFTNLVNRSQFDYFLTSRACQKEAELHDGEKVKDIIESDNGVRVITSHDSYYCQTVVGADGVLSAVARSLGLNQKQEKSITYEANLFITKSELQQKHNNILIDFNIIPYGYGWVFPKNENVSVGIGQVNKIEIPYQQVFINFLEEQKIADFEFTDKPRGYLIPKGGKISRIYKNNVLLVGDAAGLVDPLTGEGIYYALKSGLLAAEVLFDYFNKKSNLSDYQQVIERDIGSELKIARKLSYLFYNYTSVIFKLMESDRNFLETIVKTVSGEMKYKEFYNRLNKISLLTKGVKMFL